MLLVTLGLAWYFQDTVQWYEHDIQQIAHANDVLQNYQALARQTSGLLNDMNAAVAEGPAYDASQWPLKVQAVREVAEALRRDLGSPISDNSEQPAGAGLSSLADLERVLDQILAIHENVRVAVEAGEFDAVAAEVRGLYDAGLLELFDQMIESLIAEQQGLATRSQLGALNVAVYIVNLLPVLVVVLILATIVMGWLFAKNLTHSLRALHEGASAFSTGQLNYRIPRLKEKEFRRLGEEFNTMALELAQHRERISETNVKLEAVVEERTRALTKSNEQLAAIDDQRRQLLADISHEFRTPLTVIQGEAEIALRGKVKNREAYRDALQRILEQSRQTTRLVDDLLFIARADVGEPRLNPGEADIVELLESVCEDFSAKAQAKEIVIKRDFPDTGPELFADGGRLRQVFGILLDNAVKYSEDKGEVTVALQLEADAVRVTVSDRGIGLSEDELRHVFVRYYRSKRAQKHESGTGLGLPVAKAIVEAHDGEITLEARQGGGIVATVILPLGEGA